MVTIQKTICVAFILLFIISYWSLSSHWFYLFWGFISLASGPVLNECAKQWKNDRQFLGVIFISIMVAVGGLLSTLGWNKLSNFKEDHEMLIAVATEWIIMDACIDTAHKTIQNSIANENEPTLPMIVIPIPTESNYAVTHSSIVRNDAKLKHALTVYIMGIMKFNHAYQHLMQATYMPFKNKAYRRGLLSAFAKKDYPLDYLMTCHKFLGDYIKKEYSMIMSEAEQQADKDYLDVIKSMEFVLPIQHDSNSPKIEPNSIGS